MCITIPSSPRSDRNPTPGSRAWRWLAASPLRLFGAGGLLSLLLLGLTLSRAGWSHGQWLGFDLVFALFPFVLFGALLQYFPVLLRGSQVRYARYALILFLLLGSQLALVPAFWFKAHAGWFSTLLLLGGWYLLIATLRDIRRLAPAHGLLGGWVLALLWLTLGALFLSLLGLGMGWSWLTSYALGAGAFSGLAPLLLLVVALTRECHSPLRLHP